MSGFFFSLSLSHLWFFLTLKYIQQHKWSLSLRILIHVLTLTGPIVGYLVSIGLEQHSIHGSPESQVILWTPYSGTLRLLWDSFYSLVIFASFLILFFSLLLEIKNFNRIFAYFYMHCTHKYSENSDIRLLNSRKNQYEILMLTALNSE